MAVKLRYVELEPDRIFNWLDPKNITCWLAFHEWHDTWWEDETIKLREKFGRIWSEEFDKITGHFSKLEESILKDGIHHPINTASGQLRDTYLNKKVDSPIVFPPEYYKNIENSIYTHTFGGSRLSIAQKHNIKVPCIVHDFSELFKDCEEVTQSNYTKWFSTNYKFIGSTPYIRLAFHSHLSAEYAGMNNKTRQAQQTATKITKAKINA